MASDPAAHSPDLGRPIRKRREAAEQQQQKHRMQTDKDRPLISSEAPELPDKALLILGPSSLEGHEPGDGDGHDARRDCPRPRQLGEAWMAVTPSSQAAPGQSQDEPDISGMLLRSCLPGPFLPSLPCASVVSAFSASAVLASAAVSPTLRSLRCLGFFTPGLSASVRHRDAERGNFLDTGQPAKHEAAFAGVQSQCADH